ncbi:MAG TPA: hypothetical protein VEC36_06305 [Patescibacteria group bacterium]|nr:hypothetical protein [Patescibacteria group bacterium]
MKSLLKTILLTCSIFLALSIHTFAQGREVTIYLKDGKQKMGELLSVRDSLVSILKKHIEYDEDIASYPQHVEIALIRDIERVRLEEYDVSGAGKGAAIGAGIGGAIGMIAVSDNSYAGHRPETGEYIGAAAGGAIAGAFYGFIIGWATAMIMSEDEEMVLPSATKGLLRIQEYARFDEREPRYVRDIINNLLKEQK